MAMETEKPKLHMQSGSNITALKKEVKKIAEAINGKKRQRKEINDEIASFRSKLETQGIHKKALDMAMGYMSWEPEKREGFDIAYQIVREAMGMPVSDDLFSHGDAEVNDALDLALRAGHKDAILAFFTKLTAEGAFKRDEAAVDAVTQSELSQADKDFADLQRRRETGTDLNGSETKGETE